MKKTKELKLQIHKKWTLCFLTNFITILWVTPVICVEYEDMIYITLATQVEI
jgi:hypothetical protein